MNILGRFGEHAPWENLIFWLSKTAGNAPSNTKPLYGHAPVFWYNKSYCTRLKLALHAQDLVEFLPYSADWRPHNYIFYGIP